MSPQPLRAGRQAGRPTWGPSGAEVGLGGLRSGSGTAVQEKKVSLPSALSCPLQPRRREHVSVDEAPEAKTRARFTVGLLALLKPAAARMCVSLCG